jgi:hypothetical protein
MFGDGALSFREFAMQEKLPLATIQDAVLELLRGREDAVLYGAQAVNAYVKVSRSTEDVDIMSTRAEELANEIRLSLNQRFHIVVRVRTVRGGIGYRVYQVRKPENRHLVDVRPVDAFPANQRVRKVLVLTPPELVASKVICWADRLTSAKGHTDRADLARLFETFPELKREAGPVADCLRAASAPREVMAAWKKLVAEEILPEDEDGGF